MPMAGDRSHPGYGLNDLSVKPGVEFLALLRRDTTWLVSTCGSAPCVGWWPPPFRRFLCVRQPVTGRSGASLFPPSGLGHRRGWKGRCVKGVLRPATAVRPPLRVIDFVNAMRFEESHGARNHLVIGTFPQAGSVCGLPRAFHGWAPLEIPVKCGRLRKDLCGCVMGLDSEEVLSARRVLWAVSFLNFTQWLAV